MNVIHFERNSSTSTPVLVSPKTSWFALRYATSETLTSKRESRVASFVCLIPLKMSLAFLTVSVSRPSFVLSISSRFSALISHGLMYHEGILHPPLKSRSNARLFRLSVRLSSAS